MSFALEIMYCWIVLFFFIRTENLDKNADNYCKKLSVNCPCKSCLIKNSMFKESFYDVMMVIFTIRNFFAVIFRALDCAPKTDYV